MEWMIAGNERFQIACANIYLSKQSENLKHANESIFHAKEIKDAKGMDQIRYWLRKSEQNNDISYMVRAYSVETAFYRRINFCFAQLGSHQYSEEERQLWFVKFGKTLYKSEQLDKHRWTGTSFRGAYMINKDLEQYKAGDHIVNNAFLSTSKLRSIPQRFVSLTSVQKIPVICVYQLRVDE